MAFKVKLTQWWQWCHPLWVWTVVCAELKKWLNCTLNVNKYQLLAATLVFKMTASDPFLFVEIQLICPHSQWKWWPNVCNHCKVDIFLFKPGDLVNKFNVLKVSLGTGQDILAGGGGGGPYARGMSPYWNHWWAINQQSSVRSSIRETKWKWMFSPFVFTWAQMWVQHAGDSSTHTHTHTHTHTPFNLSVAPAELLLTLAGDLLQLLPLCFDLDIEIDKVRALIRTVKCVDVCLCVCVFCLYSFFLRSIFRH